MDELDKELNTYAMRVREWYGWHFPEMGKIVADNLHYAKVPLTQNAASAATAVAAADADRDEDGRPHRCQGHRSVRHPARGSGEGGWCRVIGGASYYSRRQVKDAAEVSMGTEVAQEDIDNIRELCDQVLKWRRLCMRV